MFSTDLSSLWNKGPWDKAPCCQKACGAKESGKVFIHVEMIQVEMIGANVPTAVACAQTLVIGEERKERNYKYFFVISFFSLPQ